MTDAELLAIIAQAEREGWTELDLSGNDLEGLSSEIGRLQSLEKLILGKFDYKEGKSKGNRLTSIPQEIFQLTNLKELDIPYNQITAIPDAIAQLANLTTLYLYSNQITAIPDEIANLASLTELDLSINKITEIPNAIAQLANLTSLDLHSNKITAIPDAIANLANLTSLDLSRNQITAIPDAIANLANLTSLNLSFNQITAIPDAIANLSKLKELDLSYNQIKEITRQVLLSPNLQEFHLEGNKLLELTKLYAQENNLALAPEILASNDRGDKGHKAFNYVRQLILESSRPLHEAKLLLIGQASVGKTSVMKRLIRDKYDKNQPQTDGLNVETWNVEIDSKNIRLNVWDFGGQEIYHATHQFFLTKRSLYLLICDCRTNEEDNRIEYWLKLIEIFGDKSPVIIVGNKRDEQPLDINRRALREKYPNIRAIIETSCQDNIGIDELRITIFKQVANLKEVYDLLPLSWFTVKQQLESMKEDFITYNEYIGICHENKISEYKKQEQLIDLLHRLGLVLNFRGHSILQDKIKSQDTSNPVLQSMNVLKPNWVTEGIYDLFSDETLKTKTKGIFTHADLWRVLELKLERYPAKHHRYLIELMKEFELCFAIDCNPQRFLIPAILPKDEPAKIGLEGDILEFQYHYRVLPSSIISRFIVITHDSIYNQTYWRSGVMLQYQENNETYNIARIKADPEDKKIFIAISGRKETRRLFLGILRNSFKRIHNTLPNLETTEWVPVLNYPDHPPLDYQELLGLESMGIQEYPIGKLKINIKIRELLDGYEPIESRQRSQRNDKDDDFNDRKAYEDILDLSKRLASRPIEVKAEATVMSQESKYTTNLQGANIVNYANEVKDNARQQASNFTQTSGASVAELMQIISNLRQTAAQFPQEIREDVTIEIDDVEIEIQKPEKERNLPKLKKRLLAMLAAVTFVATPIAGMTDFANNVMDIGSKLGIGLVLK